MSPASSGGRRPRLPLPGKPRGRRTVGGSGKKKGAVLRTKGQGFVVLRKPLAAGGLYRERRRLRYWRSLAPVLAGGASVPEHRLNGWLLVLAAKKIPYIYAPAGDRPRLYVPALYEGVAAHEILAFEQERGVPVFVPPARNSLPGVMLFLLLLFVWHGLRWNWFDLSLPSPPFPDNPKAWPAAFGLDVHKAREWHEWWRAVTALTLHADYPHLFSNMAFGLVFLGALCRRAGLGLGLILAVCGGILGNACNALTREAHVVSIGFSTALFAALGSLCLLAAADIFRHQRRFFSGNGRAAMLGLARRLALPLAAGLALLGFLGGGGEARTDYPAHIWGFCAGVLVGFLCLKAEKVLLSLPDKPQGVMQLLLASGAFALLAGAWLYAL